MNGQWGWQRAAKNCSLYVCQIDLRCENDSKLELLKLSKSMAELEKSGPDFE